MPRARSPMTIDDLISGALAVVVLIIFVMPSVPEVFSPWLISTGLILFIALQLYFAQLMMRGDSALARSMTLQLLAVLMGVIVLASLKSLHGGYGLRETFRDVAPMGLLLLALPVADSLTNYRRWRIIRTSLMLGTVIVALITVGGIAWLFSPARLLMPNFAVRRWIILNVDGIFLPLYLAGVAAAVAEIRYGLTRRSRRLALVALGLTVFAVFLSTTRSLYLGVCLILVTSLLVRPGLSPVRFWVRLICAGALCSVALIAVFQSNTSIFYRQTSLNAPSVQKRLAEVRSSLAAIENEPLLGRGPGYVLVTKAPEYDLLRRRTYTHNLLTYLLLHYGLVGLLVFSTLMIRVIGVHLRGLADPDPNLAALVLTSLLGLLGILAYVQFQAVYKSFSFMAYLAVALGIAGYLETSVLGTRPRETEEAQSWGYGRGSTTSS